MAQASEGVTRAATTRAGERRFLLALCGLALAVRAVFFAQAYQVPLFHAPMIDESWHDQWARQLVDDRGAYDQVFFRAPLYPYFLAAVYAVSGRSVAVARAVQLVLSVGSILLLYLIGRRLFERRVARAAALFLCIYGTLIWYEQALLIPALIIFLDLLLLWLLLRFQASESLGILATAGGVAGLSLIARPNLAVFLAGVVIWLIWRKARGGGMRRRFAAACAFAGMAALPVLPVVYHNYARSGDLIPIASQGGINFYLGNNPVADGLTMRMPELTIDEALPWDQFVPATDSIARELSGRPLSAGQINTFWTGRFVRYVLDQPFDFATGLLRKTYFFFAGCENSDNFDLYFYRRLHGLYALLVWRWGLHFPFGLVSPLALLGGWWLWQERRRLGLLYAFVGLYALTVIGVLVTARHRLPVIPILVLFAAYGAFTLVRRIRAAPRRGIVWMAVAGLLAVGLNTERFGLGLENARQSHVNLALAYKKLGDTDGVTRHLDAALAVDSGSVVALNNRAVVFLDAGDLFRARRLLEKALVLKPDAEEVRNNLATVLWRQGSFEPALAIYHDLARLHVGMVEPYYNVARIWAARQEYDSALAYYDSVLVRDSTYVEAINNKASVHLAQGDDRTARALLIDAVQLRPDYAVAGQNLVRNLLDARKPDSARLMLEVARPPWRYSVAWYHLAVRVALAQSDSARARAVIGEALQQHPDDRPTRNLARSLGL